MKRLSIIAGLLLFIASAGAQENFVRDCATRAACTLGTGIAWSSPAQTWIFNPISPDTSFRIYVHNNNTTSAHTAQTITGWITSSTSATSLINNASQWVQLAITQNTIANAKCTAVGANNDTGAPGAQGMGTCYSQGMYAAAIAIQFTPGGTQAGSPDTFDIGIVQCPSNHCNYPGGAQPGNDSSAAGGTGTLLDQSSVIGSANFNSSKALNCDLAGISTPCTPPFAAEILDTVNNIFVPVLSQPSTSPQLNGLNGGVMYVQPVLASASAFDSATANISVPVSAVLAAMAPSSGAFTIPGGLQMTEKGPRWTITSNPASGTTASASIAAAAAKRHVIDCYSFAADSSAAVVATQSSFVIRDGATGVGTIIWVEQDAIQVAAGLGIQTQGPARMCGLNLTGTTNTAMTCEFTDAGISGNHQSVSCSGYDVQ